MNDYICTFLREKKITYNVGTFLKVKKKIPRMLCFFLSGWAASPFLRDASPFPWFPDILLWNKSVKIVLLNINHLRLEIPFCKYWRLNIVCLPKNIDMFHVQLTYMIIDYTVMGCSEMDNSQRKKGPWYKKKNPFSN